MAAVVFAAAVVLLIFILCKGTWANITRNLRTCADTRSPVDLNQISGTREFTSRARGSVQTVLTGLCGRKENRSVPRLWLS